MIKRTEFEVFIKRIQDALDTQETGEALIEVARNAYRAELELASTYEGCFDDDSPLGFDGPTAAD